MIELSTIRDLVAIAGFIIALSYYILNIQNQREARKTQMFMPIYSHIISPEFRRYFSDIRVWEWKDYEDWEEKYYLNREEWNKLVYVFNIFDMVCILLNRNQIDSSLVRDTIKLQVSRLWPDLEHVVMEFRERWDIPEFGLTVEHLYYKLVK